MLLLKILLDFLYIGYLQNTFSSLVLQSCCFQYYYHLQSCIVFLRQIFNYIINVEATNSFLFQFHLLNIHIVKYDILVIEMKVIVIQNLCLRHNSKHFLPATIF